MAHLIFIMFYVLNGVVCFFSNLYCYNGPLEGTPRIMWFLNWYRDASKNACTVAKNLVSKLLLARMSMFVSLSCSLAHPPLLKHSQQNILLHLSTRYPFGGSRQDQVVIFIRFRQDRLEQHFSQLWCSCFTGRKAHWKKLKCLSCASTKAQITLSRFIVW